MATSPQVKIGYFIPLHNNLSENNSIPKIPIFQGTNVLGRHNVTVTDKRISRRHVTLLASLNGSTNIIVESSNPIVIRTSDQRKKLCSKESERISDGDIVELIPGNHFFKYVEVDNGEKELEQVGSSRKRVLVEETMIVENRDVSVKRKRQIEEDEAYARSLQVETNLGFHEDSEAIRHFNIPKERLPLTFQLLRVKGLPPWANTSSVAIRDVIQGNVSLAVLSNYMVDMDWLISVCPSLTKIARVLIIHGEGDATLSHLQKSKPANWILHKPPLPISYGTHHSKAMLLVYPRGLRVVIHTSNLIYVDWNNKSQGLWMQDFPWKDQKEQHRGSGFENDLIDYLSALKLPEFSLDLPGIGNVKINSSFFKRFDYSSAVVRLIASVPGYHSGPNLKRWGHMKLRTILQECVFAKEFQKSPLVYQFSSLGSLDEKWMAELAFSMSSGLADDKTPLGLGKAQIIWPTVEDVRCSLEGYAAGSAIPSPLKNVEKDFLKKYWTKWKATHTGRNRAMPHIKTFARYNGQNLAWFLLTSSNLSKAAWGALQKNNSQIMIRSYELGVLFLPTSTKNVRYFSCTDDACTSERKCEEEYMTKLATLCYKGDRKTGSSEVISLPVPYELPPQPYSSEDVPWSWDRQYRKKDVLGQVWPRQVQLYTSQD
ncbi:tyrosyl-DNA phosphodiesterase 1 [Ranunculus cassubicifolius]